jgi:Tol biopolymer transport system component
MDTVTGAVTPLTPEGTDGRFVSPDGQWLAVTTGRQRQLFNLKTKVLAPLKGAEPTDRLAGWAPDSAATFVSQADTRGARLFRLDIATGARSLLTTLAPEPSGLVGVGGGFVAADGDHFAYNTFRQLSQLYLIKIPD